MDAKLFRLPTKPNLYSAVESARPVDVRELGQSQQFPAPDNRFPGWAGAMSDGRLVTRYDPHCSQNIPAGKQFPTKAWMQRNADSIIAVSRKRTAELTGSIFPFDKSVEPPPVATVTCTPSGCVRKATDAPGGIGDERLGMTTPELFGTYEANPLLPPHAGIPRVAVTTVYEGGRNTPRGQRGPMD